MADEKKMAEFECIRLEPAGDVVVAKIIDERISDNAHAEKLGRELLSLLDLRDAPQVVIDFSNVTFFSSQAISKLIVMDKRAKAKGGQIRLSDLAPALREVFGFSQLDRLFHIHDFRNDAVAAIAGEPSA